MTMAIQNYCNMGSDRESRQLYEVRYDGTANFSREREAKVHLLAPSLDDAIEMFCGFYKTKVPNPREIPSKGELTDHDWQIGKNVILGIERITNAVLIRTEQLGQK